MGVTVRADSLLLLTFSLSKRPIKWKANRHPELLAFWGAIHAGLAPDCLMLPSQLQALPPWPNLPRCSNGNSSTGRCLGTASKLFHTAHILENQPLNPQFHVSLLPYLSPLPFHIPFSLQLQHFLHQWDEYRKFLLYVKTKWHCSSAPEWHIKLRRRIHYSSALDSLYNLRSTTKMYNKLRSHISWNTRNSSGRAEASLHPMGSTPQYLTTADLLHRLNEADASSRHFSLINPFGHFVIVNPVLVVSLPSSHSPSQSQHTPCFEIKHIPHSPASAVRKPLLLTLCSTSRYIPKI